MAQRSYAEATKCGLSSVSTTSSSGRPQHQGDVTKRDVDIYVATHFGGYSRLKEHIAKVGTMPACRDILSGITSTKELNINTMSQVACTTRIKNWVTRALATSAASEMKLNVADTEIQSSTPNGTPETPSIWSVSTLKVSPKEGSKHVRNEMTPVGGLRNHGNTCYLNSAIQLLYAIEHVRDAILSTEPDSDLTDAESLSKPQLLSGLRHILNDIKVLPVTETILIHEDLKRVMNLTPVTAQHDAQEVFSGLCSTAHEVLHDGKSSAVENMMQSTVLSSVTCLTCMKPRHTYAKDWVLSLACPVDGAAPLAEILSSSIETEILRNSEKIYCENCDKNTDSKKVYGFVEKPAPYLVLHLKRFMYERDHSKKITSRVTLPLKLDINFMRPDSHRETFPEYTLKAVILHSGKNQDSGHYFTIRKGQDGWLKYDDSIVTKVSDTELLAHIEGRFVGQHPYLVLYEASATFETAERSQKTMKYNLMGKAEAGRLSTENQDVVAGSTEQESISGSLVGSSESSSSYCSDKSRSTLTVDPMPKNEDTTHGKEKTLRLATRSYNNFEFDLSLRRKKWKRCWKEEKGKNPEFKLEKYRQLLRDCFHKKDTDGHELKFKYTARKRISSIRGMTMDGYAYCRLGECKWFKFLVTVQSTTEAPSVEVFSCGKTNHPAGKQVTGQLRGIDRADARRILKNKKCSTYQYDQIEKLSESDIAQGNLRTVKSDAVVRNVRSEGLAEDDLDADDIVDVLLQMRMERSTKSPEHVFIRAVKDPLQVIIFSEANVKTILRHFRYSKQIEISFDASGSCVRRPTKEDKRVLNYAATVNCSGTIVTLFEMISSRHDQFAIGDVLKEFKKVVTRDLKKKWPCIGKVTTDLSPAIINAIMTQWNDTRLTEYLRAAYHYITESHTHRNMDTQVFMSLCRNHLIHMASRNCKAHSIGKPQKYVVLEGIASLIETTSWDEFNIKFAAFCTLLLSPRKSALTQEAAATLTLNDFNVDDLPQVTNLEEEIDEHNFEFQEKLSESPFAKHCTRVSEDVKARVEDQEGAKEENQAYCPKFVEIFLDKYAPLIPLWTALMSKDRGDPMSIVSTNADVEQNFNDKKNTVHEIAHNKVGRYVRIERRHVENVVKKVGAGIITSSKAFKKNAKREELLKVIKSTTKNGNNVKIKTSSLQSRKTQKVIANPSKSKVDRYDDSMDVDDPGSIHNQEETWGYTPKKKHTYFAKENVTLLGEGRDIPVRKRKKDTDKKSQEKRLKHSKENEAKSKETDVEQWHSPPSMKKKNVGKAKMARSLSLSKQQARKTLQTIERVSHHTDTAEVEFISEEVKPAEERLQQSHYRYHFPEYDFKSKLVYLSQLTEDEQLLVAKAEDNDTNGVFIVLERDQPLYFSSFLQLLMKRPLSSDVVDVCLYDINAKYGKESCYVATYTDAHLLLAEPLVEKIDHKRESLLNYDSLFIPVKTPQHWSLAYVDLLKNELQLLDPAGGSKKAAADVARCLKNSLKRLYPRAEILLTVPKRPLSFPKQVTDYDCAILMLYYVESILRTGKCESINPEEYRIALAKRLIEMSKENCNESISMQRERKKLGCSTYENGLIQSHTYYAPVLSAELSSKRYVVCIYGKDFTEIDNVSFSALVHQKWLTNHVIDVAIYAFMKPIQKQNYVIALCRHAYEILHNTTNDTHILNYISLSDKILLMPVNMTGHHWCIAIADIKNKTFLYLDPLSFQSNAKYMDQFILFLQTRNKYSAEHIETDNWTSVTPPMYPGQSSLDSSNCGVYVILYALLSMNLVSSNEFKTPDSFRVKVAKKILEQCPNMRHICLLCGQDEFAVHKSSSVGVMIQCDSCLRWMHTRCCKKTFNYDLDETGDFTCFLCDYF